MKQVLSVIAFFLFLWVVMVASCKKDKPSPLNSSPIAKAGFDQTITLPNDSTLLDGTGSGDADGKILEWLWTAVSGPTSFAIVNATVSKTVVKNLTAGIYKFELKVTDDGGAVGRDTIQVSVIQPNRSPIAKAGADIAITLPSCTSTAVIELDGRASSDPDNSVIYYLWRKISGSAFSILKNQTQVKATVENLGPGTYLFELQVIDPYGSTSRDTVSVNVIAATPYEYNLDVTFNSRFIFIDNYDDCYYSWYYYNPCSYYDRTTIEGKFNLSSIGELNFWTIENADTIASSNGHDTHMSFSQAGNGPHAYGVSSINFEELIRKGGGSFAGTFTINGGSAETCKPDVFVNLAPLTVTGTMDTAAHTVNLNIKGKIHF